jgi:exocyst complex component 4
MYGYMQTLPLYCEHFLTMMCTILLQYKVGEILYSFIFNLFELVLQEICLAAYRGLVQPESEDKRIISTQWAKDEDISRFLR